MRYFIYFLSAFIFVALGALIGAPRASAVSTYDNAYSVTTDLNLKTTGVCEPELDVTTMWSNVFASQSGTMQDGVTPYTWNISSSVYNSYTDAKSLWDSKERWGVTIDKSSYQPFVTVWFTNDPNAYIDYHNSIPGNPSYVDYNYTTVNIHSGYSMRVIQFVYASNIGDSGMGCKIVLTQSFSTTIFGTSASENVNGYPQQIFFAYADIIYPPGYAGPTIPDSYNPPTPPSDWAPNFYVSASNDWKALIHDKYFNTFDSNPFLCGGEFAPIIHYTIYSVDGETTTQVLTGTISATAQIEFQAEKKPTSQDYRITGYYECGGSGELTFDQTSTFDFKIDGLGKLYTKGMNTCIQEAFPFLDWDSCITGINSYLSLLSFNLANPVNAGLNTAASANPNSCYTLQVLGTWIDLPNQEICPSFSPTVRNIVTPFVTFILGALVFSYISRNKASVIS